MQDQTSMSCNITERIDKMAPWVLYIYVVSSILICDGRTRSLLILFTHSYLLSIKTMTILFYQVIPRFSYIKSKVVIIARVYIYYMQHCYISRELLYNHKLVNDSNSFITWRKCLICSWWHHYSNCLPGGARLSDVKISN